MKKVILFLFLSVCLFGARLNYKSISWTADSNAVKFRLYCSTDGNVDDYNDPFEESMSPSLQLAEGICGLADGNSYLLGVSQFDSYGHESDIAPIGGLSFAADFSPLPPVSNVSIQ